MTSFNNQIVSKTAWLYLLTIAWTPSKSIASEKTDRNFIQDKTSFIPSNKSNDKDIKTIYVIKSNKEGYSVESHLDLDPSLFNKFLTLVIDSIPFSKVEQDGEALPVTNHGGKSLIEFNPYGGIIQIFNE